MNADRVDEAQASMDEARRRDFDSMDLLDQRVLLAFLRRDQEAMQQLWGSVADRADADYVLFGKARVEASRGQFRSAHRSVDMAAAMATQAGSAVKDFAAEAAMMDAEVGLPLSQPPSVARGRTSSRLLGTLVLARIGSLEKARQAADGLRTEYPSNTIVQKYGLPLIAAAVRLRSNDAAGAVSVLEPQRKYDLANTRIFWPLYPSYLRGLAYLQAGDYAASSAEFQKVLTHPGLVGRDLIGSLARLQYARAQRAMGQDAEALDSYQAFLALWQNADADIPIYRDAKAEYETLRNLHGSRAQRH